MPEQTIDLTGAISGDRTNVDPVISRLDGIFSSFQRTSYRGGSAARHLFSWMCESTSSITDSASVQPSLRVLLPEDWREAMEASPRVRAALQEALGSIASGNSSVDDLLRGWSDVLSASGLLRVASGGELLEIDALQAKSPKLESHATHAKQESAVKSQEAPLHSRLANELREMTGLGAAKLAAAFGVTREQYSRWTSGAAISDTRHGQLRYLHTVVADAVRRLGSLGEARIWFQTPLRGDETPADLLISRRWSALHQAVTEVPDAKPLVDGTRVALLAPMDDEEENPFEFEEAEGEDSWSPYASGDR